MTSPAQKAAKLLALARDPAATPDEADTARRLAEQICDKFGVQPADVFQSQDRATRELPGNVSPDWRRPRPWRAPQRDNMYPFRQIPDAPDRSGISIAQARHMALEVLQAAQQNGSCYLDPSDETLVQQAFDGLLTEYGKILLMGLHAVVVN